MNTKKNYNYVLLLIFCVPLSINTVYAQMSKHVQYDAYLLNGIYEMENKNYLQAIAYYDSASFLFPHFHKPHYFVVCCASQLHDYEKAYQSAIKMILTGCHLDIILQDDLGEFCHTNYFKQLKTQSDSLYLAGMQKRDTMFANAVLRLCKKNQSIGIRKDTATFYEFVALCVEKGAFPSCFNVGAEIYRNAFVLLSNSLWHSNYPNSEDWQKMLKLIRNEFLSDGIETRWSPLIWFEDAYCRINNIPLRYGIFGVLQENDIYPAIEELNKNRKEAGLAPIELEAKAMNIDLDILFNK